MAKRRTKEQIAADKIIKANLNILGEQIYRDARRTTRVLTGALKNSINYAVKPDTTLTMFQLDYGSDVRPAGQDSGEKDALFIAVKKNLPKGVEVIKKELTESILFPFRK
jgi:hypothetical protein